MVIRARRPSLLRGLAPVGLLPPAALAVHELRYVLAFGGDAGAMLRSQGHSYLHSLAPWIILGLALTAGAFLRALGTAFAGRRSATGFALSFGTLWLAATAALVAIYAGQEFLEGLFATGHPGGWIGIFGYGGWWAIPAAACVGLVLAAVFHGARWVLGDVAHGRAAAPRPVTMLRFAAARLRPQPWRPAPAPLAEGWSGRGPPAWPSAHA